MNDQDVLVDDIRVRGIGKSHFTEEVMEDDKEIQLTNGNVNETPIPDSITEVYFEDVGYQKTLVFKLDQLKPGNIINGPIIIYNENSTILCEPGCILEITKYGNMLIKILQNSKQMYQQI